MKKLIQCLIFFLLLPLMAGCLSVGERAYKLDYTTGIFEIVYHDIRSIKGDNSSADYLADDWKTLQNDLIRVDDYNPKVASVTSKELFRENETLAGKAIYKIQCPECFPSKADLLKMLHADETRWEIINDEIFLILPSDRTLVSTNGTLFKTSNNIISVWPLDTNLFEYTIAENQGGGESLLPRYLQENKESGGG